MNPGRAAEGQRRMEVVGGAAATAIVRATGTGTGTVTATGTATASVPGTGLMATGSAIGSGDATGRTGSGDATGRGTGTGAGPAIDRLYGCGWTIKCAVGDVDVTLDFSFILCVSYHLSGTKKTAVIVRTG